MLCFTVWECAVTPVGVCGKNVCLAKLDGRQMDVFGSWMSKSENTDDTCDGFEDYIDIVLYCERC